MSTTHQGSRPIRFAAVGLDHAHAFGQIAGLLNQGCQLVGFSSDDPATGVAQAAQRRWADVMWIEDPTSLLRDPWIDVIVTAAVPDRRSAIAVEALTNGKDVVVDKPGCITLDQLDEIEEAVTRVGSILVGHVLGALRGALCDQSRTVGSRGADRTGRAALGLGPHREGDRAHLAGGEGRPDWFYDGIGPAASSPISPATRLTSSCGSPVPTRPKSSPAPSPTTRIRSRRRCRISAR